MINPNSVNLIIFDTDGTIIPSLDIVYESIKRAFAKLDWPVDFTPGDINKFFGSPTNVSGGGLYEFIKPAGSRLTSEELREKVREEYKDTFPEMSKTFAGVRETLATLRKRGYRLVLYSNASVMYFNTVISNLNIRDYFDYTECIFENNLTKPELIRKIREKFGGLTAAVVGDRYHDIDAARETDSLSVGVLFGYGGDEPEQADVTINQFDDLLSIFDRRLPVFERITGEIDRKKSAERPFVVGITGIDTSGKTMFTKALAGYLAARNRKVQVINLDDFHNPRDIRYAGENQADNYYHQSFNIQSIIENLLLPIHRKGEHSVTLKLLDLNTDRFETDREYSFEPDTIVLFEGVFLFRIELAEYIDLKISLEIPFDESKKRAVSRDPEAVLSKYDTKYLPAQAKYLEEYPPLDVADITIDNTDWELPSVTFPR